MFVEQMPMTGWAPTARRGCVPMACSPALRALLTQRAQPWRFGTQDYLKAPESSRTYAKPPALCCFALPYTRTVCGFAPCSDDFA